MLENRLFLYRHDFLNADRDEKVRRHDYFIAAAREIFELVEEARISGEFNWLSRDDQELANKICQFATTNAKLVVAN